MTTLVKMQQELTELQAVEQTDAVQRRQRTIEARIALRNDQIDRLVELTGCRRRVLERKRGDWIQRRIESEQVDKQKTARRRKETPHA